MNFLLKIKYVQPLLHGDKVLLKSWVSSGKGARWQWKTIFQKDSCNTSALASVDLVLIKKDINGKNKLIRKGPVHIAKALEDLKIGPSC